MDDIKQKRTQREANNAAMGIKVDVDFQAMVETQQENVSEMQPVSHRHFIDQLSESLTDTLCFLFQHIPADQLKINVLIKKRPIFEKELASGEIDVISVSNPSVIVHDCKYKVDGITKFIDNQSFEFDNTFSELETNEELYRFSVEPILDLVFNTGTITIFAYGQTGSGKTFTMQGLQNLAVQDLFERGIDYWQNNQRNFAVTVSMYEIYGGKVYDLLNNHEVLKILEDRNQKIQIQGLAEHFVSSEEQIIDLINQGNGVRTTHATKSNDTSSRSHAVCQIKI